MPLRDELQAALQAEEERTVGNAFGGLPTEGGSLSYSVSSVTQTLLALVEQFPGDPVAARINLWMTEFEQNQVKYIVSSAIRFSFLIELTNLRITSTKMKTRWLPGRVVKTTPGTFTNFQGSFEPGEDQRASTFDACFTVFQRVLDLLANSDEHLRVARELATSRRIPYESVFTYANADLNPVHVAENVRLAQLGDIVWLIQARPLFQSVLPSSTVSKIRTKTYLTDRAQTGTDQTNRAKRWEVLSSDFQHATLEECWSVERGLLSDLAHFKGFPDDKKKEIVEKGLFDARDGATRCPVTLAELSYEDFVKQSAHGEADFQVGHLTPLKAGGRHQGANVAWITADGNRLQGDLEIEDVRKLLREIAERMTELKIV